MTGWRNSQERYRCHVSKWTEKPNAGSGCSTNSQDTTCHHRFGEQHQLPPKSSGAGAHARPVASAGCAFIHPMTDAAEAEQCALLSLSGPSKSCARKPGNIQLWMSINILPLTARKKQFKNSCSFHGTLILSQKNILQMIAHPEGCGWCRRGHCYHSPESGSTAAPPFTVSFIFFSDLLGPAAKDS